KLLVPSIWHPVHSSVHPGVAHYYFGVVDLRPAYLMWLLPEPKQSGEISVECTQVNLLRNGTQHRSAVTLQEFGTDRYAEQVLYYTDIGLKAVLEYRRDDFAAFNGTYRQICDSLTIE